MNGGDDQVDEPTESDEEEIPVIAITIPPAPIARGVPPAPRPRGQIQAPIAIGKIE
jgi:hypothetical protein